MKSFKELSENLQQEDLGLGKVHLPSNREVMAINRQLKADAPEVLKDWRKLSKALDKSAVTGQEIVYIRDEPDEKYRKKTGFGDAHRVVMRKRTKSPLGKEVVYHQGSNETTYNTVLAFKEEYIDEGTSASQRGEVQSPRSQKEYERLSPKDKKLVDARMKAAKKQSMSRQPAESPRNKRVKPKYRRGGVSKYGRGTEEVEEATKDFADPDERELRDFINKKYGPRTYEKASREKKRRYDDEHVKYIRKHEPMGSRLKEEDVEIDELSKKTMGRYVKRASRDLAGTEYSLGRAEIDEPGKKQFKRLAKRSKKRLKGIGTAAKKLSKEDVEIDEAQRNPKETAKYRADRTEYEKLMKKWTSTPLNKVPPKTAKRILDIYKKFTKQDKFLYKSEMSWLVMAKKKQVEEATKVGAGKVPVYVEDPRPGKEARQVIGYVSKQATSIGAVKVSKDAYPGRKARAEKTVFDRKRYPSGVGWEVFHS